MDNNNNTEKALIEATDSMLTQTAEFAMQVIGMPIPQVPIRLDPDRKNWAYLAIAEELTEFVEATTLEDEVDALVDMTYFALGRLVEMGIAPAGPFGEVQRANMSKRRGELSKRPGSKGFDAVKPYGWVGPSHADLLTLTSGELAGALARRKVGRDNITDEELRTLQALREGQARVITKSRAYKRANPRLLIMGYARHGKDTVCELLRDRYGYRFTSSSMFCAEHVVLPASRDAIEMPFYDDAGACFEDRVNHRKFWFDTITAYNTPDKSRLGREIFESFDIYCGIRNAEEFQALKLGRSFDLAIWVDASDRVASEGADSCTVMPSMADYVLDNNGTVEELGVSLGKFMEGLSQ
jgi:hypothetical protein